jgi:hypothetical protein
MELIDHLHTATALVPETELSPPIEYAVMWAHSQSGRFGKEKNLLLLPGIEPRIFQCIA